MMTEEEEDPNGFLQGEEGNEPLSTTVNELKLNFELQSPRLLQSSRLLAITDYQCDMLIYIDGNFENYSSESEARYEQSASEIERIFPQLAELRVAMLAGKFPSKKAMGSLGSKPRVGFSQVMKDPISPITMLSVSTVKLDIETPSLDCSNTLR